MGNFKVEKLHIKENNLVTENYSISMNALISRLFKVAFLYCRPVPVGNECAQHIHRG